MDMSHALAYDRIAAFHAITNDPQSSLLEKCNALLELGQQTFGLAIALIARVHDDVYEVVAAHPSDARLFPGARFPLAHTYCSVTIRSDEPVGFDRATGGDWELHPCFREFCLEAYLGAVIRVDGKAWGTVSFANFTPTEHPHPEHDFLFLKLIAQWLGQAIEAELRQESRAALEAEAATARRQAFFRDIVHAIGEGVLAVDAVPPHRIRFVNSVAETVIGHAETDIVGLALADTIRIASQGEAELPARLAESGPFETLVSTPWRKEPFPIAFISARPIAQPGMIVLTFREMSAEWQDRENLRLAEQVFEYSPEAILVTDADGTILRVNPAFTLITGFRPEEAIGRNPRILRSGRQDGAFYQAMWRDLLEKGHWHGEIWDKRKSGEIYPKWLCINAVHLPAGGLRFVALFADISERKEHEQRIDYLAHHDVLTGMANRRQLEDRAGHILARTRHDDAGVALLLIDMDRFKPINDQFGHAIGDQLLVEVARRLNGCIRVSDVVARLGGDEFVVLVDRIGHIRDVAQVAEKIRGALAAPYEIGGHSLLASASIGISLCPADATDLTGLLEAADLAMYQVKLDRGNGWRFHEDDMDEAVRARHQLEIDLRTALELGQFRLHYQPQFDLDGARIIAWEALLRWQHPVHGLIEPERFIALAEETGLIVPIGKWVLETACRDALTWNGPRNEEERIAVNVSVRQIEHEKFADDLASILARTGLPARRLELELTESVLMANTSPVRKNIEQIKKLGIRLTLDDFGTGYSTFSNLTHFTVDRLKIDRSFMADVSKPSNAAIIAAVVSLAAVLQLEVVAEGVETGDQMAFLLEKGCLRVQGFLYGSPIPSDEVMWFGIN